MGKIKSRKKQERRKKPTGLQSVKEASQEIATGCPDQTCSLAFLEKLNSGSDEEKESSCLTVASLVFDPGCITTLMKQNLVKRIAPLLVDKSRAVQIAAAGALRNISLSGGTKVCQKMVEDDVMTPLTVFAKQTLSHLQESSSKVEKDEAAKHAVQAIGLLWDLCECSGVAVDILDRENMFPVLISSLTLDVFPVEVIISAAHCLHTYSEDNASLAEKPGELANLISTLEKVFLVEEKSSNYILLKVLASGILFNILTHVTEDIQKQIINTISTVFSQTMAVNCVDHINSLLIHPSVPEENGVCIQTPKMTEDKDKINEVLTLLDAQQTCLEILSNMCCRGDENDDEWEDIEDEQDVSDEEQEATDTEMESADGAVSEEVITSIVSKGIPKMVFDACALIDLNKISCILNSFEEGKRCLKKLQVVQNRSLVCLNNMLSNIPAEILGGPETFPSLWDPIFNLAFKNQGMTSSDEEFMEAAASSVRSLMEKMAEFNLMQHVKLEQALLICQMGQNIVFEPAKVNLLNTIGIIGRMASKESNSLEILKNIGEVLKNVATSNCHLWVVAEALDALFDTFADGPMVDSAALSIGLLNELQHLVPVLKNRIKKERLSVGEHWPVVQAAKTNLIRFIKYKTGS